MGYHLENLYRPDPDHPVRQALSTRHNFRVLMEKLNGIAFVVDEIIVGDDISVAALSAISADLGSITAGDITLDDEGFIRTAGKDSYADTTAGFWLGYDTDKYKLNIGNATDYLKWTGSAIQIKSSGALSNINVNLGTITAGIIDGAKFKVGGYGSDQEIYFKDSSVWMYDDLDGTKKKIGWKYGDLKFGEFFYNTVGRTHFVLRSGASAYSTVLYSRASDNTGFVFILGPADQMPCWIRLNKQGHIVLSAVATAPTTNVTMGSFSYNSAQDRPVFRNNTAWRHWEGTSGW